MKKKKILHIVESFGGGVYTFLLELSNGLTNNFDIVIAYSKRNQTPENFKEQFDSKIKFIEVNNFTRSINPKKDFKALKEIKEIVKLENPDIVHMHSSKAGVIGRLAISTKNRKLYYTPHGYSFLKQDDSKLKRFIYKFIEKSMAIYRKECTIVGCSEGEYKESLKLNKNSTYVNNGVNTNQIDEIVKRNKKLDLENLSICTVGRIGYQKNPKLFNDIAAKFPEIKFTWIGDGELKEVLTSKNIKITGWLDRENVLKELRRNDIFLLPSLWEGLPIALLEAMYLGKICVVSNVIGNRDVIKNKQNGFVCNDLNEFEKLIRQIKDDKYNLDTIKSKVQLDIVNNYNIEVMKNNYIKLYNKENK